MMSTSIAGSAGGRATGTGALTWWAAAAAVAIALTAGIVMGRMSKTVPAARPVPVVVVPAAGPAVSTTLEERTQARLKAELARNILGFERPAAPTSEMTTQARLKVEAARHKFGFNGSR